MRRLIFILCGALAGLLVAGSSPALAQSAAMRCYQLKPLQAKLQACREAIRINPDDFPSHNNMGTALEGLGRYEEALAAYRKAVKIKPDFAYAHSGMGYALENLGRYEEALAAYRKAIQINPDFAWAKNNLRKLLAKVEDKRSKEQARLEADRKRKERERHSRLEAERKRRQEEARLEADRKRKHREEQARLEAEDKRKEGKRLARLEAERKRKEQERLAKLEAQRKRRERERGPMQFRFRKGPVNKHAVAVIIGNRNYSAHSKNIPNVTYAHNDADAVYEYVTKALGYRPDNIMFYKDATQADLFTTFGTKEDHKGKLYNWIKAGKSDVFVFYSGHGVPGLSDGKAYLLPVNAEATTAHLNGYPLDTLYANLAKLPARRMTVMIDACFSGTSAGGTLLRGSPVRLRLQRTSPLLLLSNSVVLSASASDEVAWWDDKAKLGLFTRHVLEGLSGAADKDEFGNDDGKVTLAELRKFLKEELTYRARRRYGQDQHPQVRGEMSRVMHSLR